MPVYLFLYVCMSLTLSHLPSCMAVFGILNKSTCMNLQLIIQNISTNKNIKSMSFIINILLSSADSVFSYDRTPLSYYYTMEYFFFLMYGFFFFSFHLFLLVGG